MRHKRTGIICSKTNMKSTTVVTRGLELGTTEVDKNVNDVKVLNVTEFNT